MRKFYAALSEKDRRRYAAVEAEKLGHGGITYVAKVLGCAQSTIATGIVELAELPEGSGYDPRIRRLGGGRKPYGENHQGIDEAFLDVLKDNTAGDPMREKVLWTNLTQLEIAERLQEQHGIQVSETVVEQFWSSMISLDAKPKKRVPEGSRAP